ncbi:threonine--tRNA ligase [candidate division KSB1 bacterium]|nr:threonine--tRNA ligase [candidate division KSB1 bacterium]
MGGFFFSTVNDNGRKANRVEAITITFPDGKSKQYEKGIRPQQILQELGGRLAKETIAAKINDIKIDLYHPIDQDGNLQFITYETDEGRDIFWHSSAHVMAHAIKAVFPEAKFAFGPPVDTGFYYDVDLDKNLTPDDLDAIEQKMQEIVKKDQPFERQELELDEAIQLFRSLNEDYKVEQIERLGEPPSVYKEGEFYDLCRGPHVPSTGYIRYFKLLSIAGAYWLGDEKNPQLQRVYGVSFPKKSQLEDYLKLLEEAKKRDHRRLGKDLDLFSIHDEIGPGLVLWHPKGAFVRHKIEEYWKDQHLQAGYEFVNTPHVAKIDLWETSGHVDFFAENMFSPMEMDELKYMVKPMNCPFHLTIYKNEAKSYRDLPIRWAELGTVYRYERSGVLHGLLRVRGFTQDDAHIFCRPDQLDDEITRVLTFSLSMLRDFGFEQFDVFLSTRPEKYVGTIENWDRATEALRLGLERTGTEYEIDDGEGVFYGPKIDIKIRDVLGRSWQCSTIQVDFNEPERFNLTYIGEDGYKHQPIMVHRALLGSLERFFGVMIEHFAGAFPVWMAPVQVQILPITDKQHEYARTVHDRLLKEGIRSVLDDRSEKVGYKIREAATLKIPFMLIIGEKEVESMQVAVRKRFEGDLGSDTLDNFIKTVHKAVAEKAAN